MSATPILGDVAEFAKVVSGALTFIGDQYRLHNTPEMIANGQAKNVTAIADQVNALINKAHDESLPAEEREKALRELQNLDS